MSLSAFSDCDYTLHCMAGCNCGCGAGAEKRWASCSAHCSRRARPGPPPHGTAPAVRCGAAAATSTRASPPARTAARTTPAPTVRAASAQPRREPGPPSPRALAPEAVPGPPPRGRFGSCPPLVRSRAGIDRARGRGRVLTPRARAPSRHRGLGDGVLREPPVRAGARPGRGGGGRGGDVAAHVPETELQGAAPMRRLCSLTQSPRQNVALFLSLSLSLSL